MTETEVQAWFATWVTVKRDYAISMMLTYEAKYRESLKSSELNRESLREGVVMGVDAVDAVVHGLLYWLWSDDRIQMHYVDKDGTKIDMKRASDGWHGDYVGYGTHGGWIHELSKYKDGLPPVNNG